MRDHHQLVPAQLGRHDEDLVALERLSAAIHAAAEGLSDQGPLETFIHHNTLHAFANREFHHALEEARDVLGCATYLDESEYRAAYQAGRITDRDLEEATRQRFMERAAAQREGVAHEHDLPSADLRGSARESEFADESTTSPLRAILLHDYEAAHSGSDAIWRAGHELIDLVAAWPESRRARARAWLLGELERPEDDPLGAPSQPLATEIVRRWCGVNLMSAFEQNWLTHRFNPSRGASLEDSSDSMRLRGATSVRTLASRIHMHRWQRGQSDRRAYRIAVGRRLARLAAESVERRGEGEHGATAGISDVDIDAWIAHEAKLVGDFVEDELGLPRHPRNWRRHLIGAPTRLLARVLWSIALQASRVTTSVVEQARRFDHSNRSAALPIDKTDQGERLSVDLCRTKAKAYVAEVHRLHAPLDVLRTLSGSDLIATFTECVVGLVAGYLDEGLARWSMPSRPQGLFACLIEHSRVDRTLWPVRMALLGAADAKHSNGDSSSDGRPALRFCQQMLTDLGVGPEDAERFVGALLRRMWGWSAMVKWRSHHSARHHAVGPTPRMEEWLAVLLAYEVSLAGAPLAAQLGRELTTLRSDLERNIDEVAVRAALWSGRLPGVLARRARACLAAPHDPNRPARLARTLDAIASFERREASHTQAWLIAACVARLPVELDRFAAQAHEIATVVVGEDARFHHQARLEVWQVAFEANYRRALLSAIEANAKREIRSERDLKHRALFQAAFCIDDREESLRRHLEEQEPGCETFGVAGFFGVPVRFHGADREDHVDLCPPGVAPIVEVRACSAEELARRDASRASSPALRDRSRVASKLASTVSRELHAATHAGPSTLLALPADGVRAWSELLFSTLRPLIPWPSFSTVAPPLAFDRRDSLEAAADGTAHDCGDVDGLGLPLAERTRLVEATLRNMGLVSGFAPIVAMVGHGSMSSNNPHVSAYACGACGGSNGGPTARVFVRFANDPQVRRELSQRGISIPADTTFLAAEHDTCADIVTFFDLERVPASERSRVESVHQTLAKTCRVVAHERARRLSGGELQRTPEQAFRWMSRRAHDLSQVRPELGHANNASAIVGRRRLSRDLFLDRRAFLVSYDPDRDDDGTILGRILAAVVPVCSGISLEYYFSRVDQAVLGAGTKLPHNVVGLIGVMNGACSDLRTGLPKQMIEIHEPMRLAFVIDAPLERVRAVLARQPAVARTFELGWAQLSVIDAGSGVFILDGRRGFIRSAEVGSAGDTPTVASSIDCYQGLVGPVPPKLITSSGERMVSP